MRVACLASILLVIALAISVAPAAAQGRFEIKYRVVGDMRPGSEVIFQFMMVRVSSSGDFKPVMDAVFEASVNGEKPITVAADEGGIASIPVKISPFSVLGSTIRVEVQARSQLYGVEVSRTVTEAVPPDPIALAPLLMASISILAPIILLVRRMGG